MNKKSFWREHWIEFVASGGAILMITAWALWPTYRGTQPDATNAGQFGDFIGGFFGTIFLIISVALLVGSYRNQRSTTQRTIFETRFFELLKYHRENVDEMGIGEKSGRRVFVSFIREFREALEIVRKSCVAVNLCYDLPRQVDLAYMAFYYGVGPNSTRIFEDAVKHHPQNLVSAVITRLSTTQSDYRSLRRTIRDDSAGREMRGRSKEQFRSLTRLSYCPFDGHQSRLGHYFRHLYQMTKYVDIHAPEGTGGEYADLIRAQLTNHEQALFCLNALSRIGRAWVDLGYVTKYSMIQNIPESFFDSKTELDIKREFPEICFEYEKLAINAAEPNRDELVVAEKN